MRRLDNYRNAMKNDWYLELYERLFSPLQDKPVKLLELGVLRGTSLLMWADYFVNGEITGLDIEKIQMPEDNPRVRVYHGDQCDFLLLSDIAHTRGRFDIIIDDAAHQGRMSRASYDVLFHNYLKPGGIYVVEDWGTGYWGDWPDGQNYGPNHYAGMVGFIKDLVDITAGPDTRTTPNLSQIKSMELSYGQCVLHKRGKLTWDS